MSTTTSARSYRCEAVVAAGLEEIARGEMERRLGDAVRFANTDEPATPGAIPFDYMGDPRALIRLHTVLAVYLVGYFAVPRPRALLGEEHLRDLLDGVAQVRALWPPASFGSLYLSAAGADSSVMARLADEVAGRMGLSVASGEGDLQLRLRRPVAGADGWEVLVRLSPRPLATRAWRVCNLPGALNASVAHAMALLTQPRGGKAFLNVGCGSGTLLVERLACGPAARAIGCDIDPEALRCAAANVAASGHEAAVELYPWDARALPLASGSIGALCADLPFGHLSGSHAHNKELYPALLAEAARVARAGALFAAITHETRLMREVLAREESGWETLHTLRVTLGEVRPTIFLLRRR